MTIQEFIKKLQTGEITADLICTKTYISYLDKKRIAEEVINLSVEYDHGFIQFDSYKKYISFIFAVIEAHTNLCFADNWDDKIQEYDALCENELLDVIIDTFRKDYECSFDILDMMCDDLLKNNSVEASVAKLVNSISENLDVFIGALSDRLGDFDVEKIIPKDLDLDKLQELLNNFK